jgi:transposase
LRTLWNPIIPAGSGIILKCKAHLTNILAFFENRLANGPIEGLNNKIQNPIKKVYDYRNKQRFITDIFFHLG